MIQCVARDENLDGIARVDDVARHYAARCPIVALTNERHDIRRTCAVIAGCRGSDVMVVSPAQDHSESVGRPDLAGASTSTRVTLMTDRR